MKKRLSTILLLLFALLLAGGCLGPKPQIKDSIVTAPQKGSDEPYKVEIVLANEGPGGGQVLVDARLVSKQTGETIADESDTVELEKGETTHVFLNIDLPPSAQDMDPQDLRVDIQATYPVE